MSQFPILCSKCHQGYVSCAGELCTECKIEESDFWRKESDRLMILQRATMQELTRVSKENDALKGQICVWIKENKELREHKAKLINDVNSMKEEIKQLNGTYELYNTKKLIEIKLQKYIDDIENNGKVFNSCKDALEIFTNELKNEIR